MSTPTPEEEREAQIAYYEKERDRVRAAISKMTGNNVQRASFQSSASTRDLEHLPVTELREIEADYTVKINDLRVGRHGLSGLFGMSVKFTD